MPIKPASESVLTLQRFYMKLIFHSRFPLVNKSGEKTSFIIRLLFAFAESNPDKHIVFLTPDFISNKPGFPKNTEWIKRPAFSGSSRLLEKAWKTVQLPRIIKKTKAEILQIGRAHV